MTTIRKTVVYQLKVALDGITPSIWRRLLVPASISLKKLHDVLQRAMGWENAHLHQFEARGEIFGDPDPEFGADNIDEARVRLDKVLIGVKDTMHYEYDFGDGWRHKIVLEKIDQAGEGTEVPVCTGGARACPPEDCGGIPGYKRLLRVLGDPSHPEHDEMLEWVGGAFDPERFDVAKVNTLLAGRRRRP
ncbi:MAG: plasmid pRiA4b ORF-3 family protein [Gammaproteobacteria bacterium]